MTSVRITAAGAVAFACLSFLTAPVSACDERYIKKCERASAAVAAAASEETVPAPAAKRKTGRVHAIVSRRGKRVRFVQRTHAPRFVRHARELTLASAESRMTTLPETPLARRFRGFINPQPLAQNAFEALRKPHIVADNLEPPATLAADPPATPGVEEPAKPAVMELASAESKPIKLPELPALTAKPAALASATVTPIPAPAPVVPQAVVSEAPSPPPAPSRFPIHSLVLALCGALGAAGALRFIVGA